MSHVQHPFALKIPQEFLTQQSVPAQQCSSELPASLGKRNFSQD